MKKCLLILLLLTVLTVTVTASPMHIVDAADLLPPTEEAMLEQKAAQISEEYQMDIVIVTVLTTYGQDAQDYADDYFDQNSYGKGDNNSGVLLLLVMDTREWVISTCGDTIDTMSNSDAEYLFDSISAYIAAGEYYYGFDQYLTEIPVYLVPTELSATSAVFISILIGLVAGGIGLLILRSGMKTARKQQNAGSYVVPGSYKLLRHNDFYLYSTTTRIRKESNNSSGTHRSSSGRSHGGSRGRF